MESADQTFFYAARNFGLNTVIISLVEQPQISTWQGRFSYCRAKAEMRAVDVYAMDLLFMLVKAKYQMDSARFPSDIEIQKPKDTRSGKQILEDIRKRMERV